MCARRENDATARSLTFTTLVLRLLSLITVNRSWSRNIVQILRSPNAAYRWVMVGATLFLLVVLYVPFLRSALSFVLHSLEHLGFATISPCGLLISLVLITRFTTQT